MTIAIVTDSTASLAAEDARREGIYVVPISVIIGAEVFTEGADVTADMIASALRDGTQVTTSRPSAETFESVYRALAAQGVTEIVSVHISALLSGTVDSARLAASRVDIPVHVVDSRQVGLATGFAAGRAARVAREGGSIDEVIAAAGIEDRVSSVFLYVDSLEYLRRGGRVGRAASFVGSALSVRPILTVREGTVLPLEKVRTSSRALARLTALAIETAQAIEGEFDIGVQHLASQDRADAIASELAESLGRPSVAVDEVGASLGAHVGPGMIGITIAEW